MDFALLPPEVNSGRMYSGAGAGPLLAAASSWDALGAELNTAGLAYEAVLTELCTVWAGPTATAMAAAAAPYAQWMRTAAIQAEETAMQARAATAAYESAFAMTVPPPVIAANRSLLMTLVATNFLGQNTPAIAAAEAHYAQMWAQDATAMYGYSAGAAAAARLEPFTQPPRTTNSAAAAGHAAAHAGHAAGHAGHAAGHAGHAAGHAGHAAGHAGHAAGHAGHAAGHVGHASGHAGHAAGHVGHASAAGHAVGHAAATAANGQGGGVGGGITQGATFPTAAGASSAGASVLAGVIGPAAASASAPAVELSNAGLELVVDSVGTFGIDALGTFLIDPLGVAGVGEELLRAAMAGAMPVSAGFASATSLSGLSVPLSWASAAPVMAQQVGMSLVSAATNTGNAVATGETVVPAVGMAAAGLAGRASASAGRGRGQVAGTTTARTPSRQPNELPELTPASAFGLLMGADVELRELAELRDAGVLTDEEYAAQKRSLVGR